MKKALWILVIVALLLGAALPYLCSVPPGKWLFEQRVSRKLRADVRIASLSLSWLGPQRAEGVALKSAELDGQIGKVSSPVKFWELNQFEKAFALENGALQIHVPGYPEAAIEQLSATVQGPEVKATGVTREGDETGNFSLRATSQDQAEIALTKMPSVLLDRWLGMKLSPIIGSSFNLQGAVKSQAVDLDFSAPNASASIAATVQNDVLTLREPLIAQLKLTAESSQMLFGRIVESQDPILLKVQPDGFAASRKGQLTIGNGSLDLGRLVVSGVRGSSQLFTLLKRSPRSNMSAWFTSVDFSYKQRVLELGRLDCLLDGSLHLCSWGRVDVGQDKLDLILGIPSDTLQNAFGLLSLPPNYVLKIPVQGTIENPELVTGPAAAKIAALVTAQTTLKQTPFGKVLGAFNAVTNDSSDVPPPKRPFPWER